MLSNIINFSLRNKFLVLLFTIFIISFGLYALSQIPIGGVPDVTNNQVQVIITSRNLVTEDTEQFITYPVELQMANLLGVTEIRSISKFGLSVVTIVFEDDMGTYLPRQLIAKKNKSASEKIPKDLAHQRWDLLPLAWAKYTSIFLMLNLSIKTSTTQKTCERYRIGETATNAAYFAYKTGRKKHKLNRYDFYTYIW